MTGYTYQQIANGIEDIGLPFAYYSFPTDQAPPLPYLVYFYPNREDFIADNENYSRVETLVVELYTETKDLYAESVVEAFFDYYEIVYDKTETFINKENMYQCYYETQVLIVSDDLS